MNEGMEYAENQFRMRNGVPSFYEALGVQVDATPNEIRKVYRILARRYHPDKNLISGNPQSTDDEHCLSMSSAEMFSLIARAYEILIDPTKRAAYDMVNGFGNKSLEYSELREMKKQDAEQAVELMRLTFDIKRRTELSRGGLVIDDAVYGARDIIETNKLEDLSTSKWVQNVTRQLQCTVERSKLVIAGNEPKHYIIPGLYDPAPGEEKLLWVRYYFRGKIHQAVVLDEQRLLMPLKSHCIHKLVKTQSTRASMKTKRRGAQDQSLTKGHSFWLVAATSLTFALGVVSLGATFYPFSKNELPTVLFTRQRR